MVRAEWCLPPTRLGKWSEAVSTPKPTPSIEATRVDGGCVVYRLPVQEHPQLGVFLGYVVRGQASRARSNRLGSVSVVGHPGGRTGRNKKAGLAAGLPPATETGPRPNAGQGFDFLTTWRPWLLACQTLPSGGQGL